MNIRTSLIAAALIIVGWGARADLVLDVSRDYSTTSNPNPIWSYGYKAALNGQFTPLSYSLVQDYGSNSTVHRWLRTSAGGPPSVQKNIGTYNHISDGGQGNIAPEQVWFGPGSLSDDAFTVIRCVIPSDGEYRLDTAVRTYLDGPISGDCDLHVLKNGTELFGEFLPGTSGTSYSNTLDLSAGDIIDFAVGRGADNSSYASGLKIQATLESVTTPPPPPQAVVFDVSTDFSVSTNPTPTWGYGWKSTLAGAFTAFPVRGQGTSENGLPVAFWAKNTYEPAAVFFNANPQTVIANQGQGVFPPGTVWVGPGVPGNPDNFGVLRLTIPAGKDGTYRLESAVKSSLDGDSSGDSEYHIIKNGTELFGQFLDPRSATGYTNVLQLVAGDVLDFAVGNGNDAVAGDSGLKVQARLTQTQEPPPPPTVTLDVERDYSTNENPGTAWSYGWKPSLDGAFTLLPYPLIQSYGPGRLIHRWLKPGAGSPPSVNKHIGTVTHNDGEGNYPPGVVWFGPGDGNERFGVIRCVIPASGTYRLHTVVWTYLEGPISGDCDFHVVKNGTELFGQFLPGTSGTSYSNELSLAAGDIIDFAVGRGADDSSYASGLKIQAQLERIAEEPPPPPTGLTLSGLLEFSTDAAGNFFNGSVWNTRGGDTAVNLWVAKGTELHAPFVNGPSDAQAGIAIELQPGVNEFVIYGNQGGPTPHHGLNLFFNGNNNTPRISVYGQTQTSTNPPFPSFAANSSPSTLTLAFNPVPGAGTLVYQQGTTRVELTHYRWAHPFVYNIDRVSQPVATPDGGPDFIGRFTLNVTTGEPPPPPPTNCTPAGSGLIAWWRGEGDASDSVGSNHGQLQGGTSFAPGRVGQGFVFDGVDDFILVPDSASLDLTHEITMEMWFNSQEWGQNRTWALMDKRTYNDCNYGAVVSEPFGFQLYYNDPNVSGSTFEISAHFPLPTTGEFHHFAGTYRQVDPGHIELKTYLDGALVRTQVFSGNLANTVNNMALAIGSARGGADGGAFRGIIDEVSLYNRALTAAEVQAIYSADSGGKCPNVHPVITVSPESQVVAAGSSVSFMVQASGTPPLNYQWLFNGAEISGATVSTLTLTGIAAQHAGQYSVRVSNSEGSATSAEATLTVTAPVGEATYDLERDYSTNANPAGVWHYGWKTATDGVFSLYDSHTFIDLGGGELLDYWKTSSGSASSMLYHNAGTKTHYSDGGQGVYLPGDVWHEAGSPNQPEKFAVIRFSVPAGGEGSYRIDAQVRSRLDGPVSGDYDWHVLHNNAELFGRFMPPQSATGYSNTLTLVAGDTIDFATGNGADGNPSGSGIKIKAFITLVSTNPPSPEPPNITTQPQSLTVSAGSSAAFWVTVSGTGPFAYQWSFNGAPIPGGTSSTLGIPNAQPSHAGEYRVQVSNWAGIVMSSNATLTVQGVPPSISNPRVDYSAVVGGSVTMSISASGSAPLSYQWFFNGGLVPDATLSSLTLNNVQMSQAGTYNVVVSNPYGSVTNGGAILRVSDGQGGGTVNFSTIGIYVYDVDGVTRLPVGPTYLGQLYAGPDSSTLRPMGGAVPVGPQAGIFFGGTRTITNVAPGQVASVQVRVWESAYGSTYDQALVNGGKTGASIIAQVTTANPNASPPQPPAYLSGLANFALIPGTPASPPEINSHPVSQTVSLGAPVSFAVSASGPGLLRYQWQLNGVDLPGAVASTLSIGRARSSDAGEYRVIVSNGGGPVTSTAAILTVTVDRTLAVVSPADQQEGGLVEVPIELTSAGDVSGMTFVLHFNPDYLSVSDVVWGDALQGAFKESNVPRPGQLRAVFAQFGGTVPSGTQVLARVNFRARTVPVEASSELNLEVVEVSDSSGDPILYGTDVRHGTARTIGGSTTLGDNNGNGRLDVGDATLLLRMLAQSDTTRSWDVPRNDFNQNTVLDSGDVVRLLRAVSEAEPPPEGAALAASGSTAPEGMAQPAALEVLSALSPELALLSPSTTRLTNGQLVRVQVKLENIQTAISAASFSLYYPTAALRLVGAQGYRVGPVVPANAAVVWGVTQPGRVTLATSSSTPWPSRDGVLAELTFEVQPGAADQYGWPLALRGVEITPDGYAPRAVPGGGSVLIGRPASPGALAGLRRNPAGGFEFTVVGDQHAGYRVEASTDLVNWTTLREIVMSGGSMQLADPDAVNFSRRFYRARPVE